MFFVVFLLNSKVLFWIPCKAVHYFSKTKSQCLVWFIVDYMFCIAVILGSFSQKRQLD